MMTGVLYTALTGFLLTISRAHATRCSSAFVSSLAKINRGLNRNNVERIDGSEEDFSYRNCFNMPTSEKAHRQGYTWKKQPH